MLTLKVSNDITLKCHANRSKFGYRTGNICGTGTAVGDAWTEQRKFMFKAMGDLGMGNKEKMETVISG